MPVYSDRVRRQLSSCFSLNPGNSFTRRLGTLFSDLANCVCNYFYAICIFVSFPPFWKWIIVTKLVPCGRGDIDILCTVLDCTVLCCAVLHCTVLYCTGLYCTGLYCTVLYCAVPCCTVLYCTVLYCAVLYCAVLYCAVLYCAVPYSAEPFPACTFRLQASAICSQVLSH